VCAKDGDWPRGRTRDTSDDGALDPCVLESCYSRLAGGVECCDLKQ
jgi:hypothetical protein